MDGLSEAQKAAVASVSDAGHSVLESKTMERLASQHKQRTNIAKEIISTEQTYVQVLNNIVNAFLTPLKAGNLIQDGIVTLEERRQMFPNALQILLQCHSQFLASLEARLETWSVDTCFGDLFLDMINYFKLYPVYVSNFEQQLRCIRELTARQPRFAEFVKGGFVILQDSNSSLPTLLITPVQRIPRYLMLIKDFRKRTPESHPDYPGLTTALEKLGDIATYVEQKAQDAENVQKMMQIQEQIQGKYPTIMAPQRRFVFQGFVNDVRGKDLHARGLFLFNDIVVWAKAKVIKEDLRKTKGARKGKQPVASRSKGPQIEYTWGSTVSLDGAEAVEMEDVNKTIKFCFGLKLEGRNHLVSVADQKTKTRWLDHFAACIKEFNDKAAENDKLKSMAELRKYKHQQALAAAEAEGKETEKKSSKKERKGWRFRKKQPVTSKPDAAPESLTLPINIDSVDSAEMPKGFRSARTMSSTGPTPPKGAKRSPRGKPRSLRGSPQIETSRSGTLVIKKTIASRALSPEMKKANRSSRRIVNALPEGYVDEEHMQALRNAFESFDHMDDKALGAAASEDSASSPRRTGHRRSLSSPAGMTISPAKAGQEAPEASSVPQGAVPVGGISKAHPKMMRLNKSYRNSAYALPKNAGVAAVTPEELALDKRVEMALRQQKLKDLSRDSMATPPRPRRRPPKLAEANVFRKSNSRDRDRPGSAPSGSKKCISCSREMPEFSAVCDSCEAAQAGSGYILGKDGEALAVEMIYVDEQGNPVSPPRDSESVSFEEMVEVVEDDGSYEYETDDAVQVGPGEITDAPWSDEEDADEEGQAEETDSESRSSDLG